MPTYIKSENLLYVLSICNMAITLISFIRSNRKGMLNDTGSYVHIVQVLIISTHYSRTLYMYNKSTKYLIIILDSYFIFIHVIIIHKIFFLVYFLPCFLLILLIQFSKLLLHYQKNLVQLDSLLTLFWASK